jgi:hypothetical protein
LGIGDWGLGPIPNPQSPIPNPQSPYIFLHKYVNIILYLTKKVIDFLTNYENPILKKIKK